MNTQSKSGATALVLLALIAGLGFASQHRPRINAHVDSSSIAPERERNRISFALEVDPRPHEGTIVRISARATFPVAGG